jgi:hypothetical protein
LVLARLRVTKNNGLRFGADPGSLLDQEFGPLVSACDGDFIFSGEVFNCDWLNSLGWDLAGSHRGLLSGEINRGVHWLCSLGVFQPENILAQFA